MAALNLTEHAAPSGSTARPGAVTTAIQFFNASSDGAKLFQVRPGHSIETALNHASCFLVSARDMAYAEEHVSSNSYNVGVMVEMAKALIDSVMSAMALAPSSKGNASADEVIAQVVGALDNLIAQVESGSSANTCRAVAALQAWNATKGGAA